MTRRIHCDILVLQSSGTMELLPHLHHIVQTVEDVFPRLLRLDAHFCLVLCRRLQEEKHSGEVIGEGRGHWGVGGPGRGRF